MPIRQVVILDDTALAEAQLAYDTTTGDLILAKLDPTDPGHAASKSYVDDVVGRTLPGSSNPGLLHADGTGTLTWLETTVTGGVNKDGKVPVLDNQGLLDISVLPQDFGGPIHYVGAYTPNDTQEYPPDATPDQGDAWLAVGLTAPYVIVSGELAGTTVDQNDLIVYNGTEWTYAEQSTSGSGYLTLTQAEALFVSLTGSTITGPIIYDATPSVNEELVNKAYVDGLIAAVGPYLEPAGGALSGPLTYDLAPTADNELVNKAYVDQSTGVGVYLPLAGGEVTGPVVYSAAPVADDELVNKAYVDALGGFTQADAELLYVSLTGDVLTGPLLYGGVPADDSELVNKGYVDTLILAVSDILPPDAAGALTNDGSGALSWTNIDLSGYLPLTGGSLTGALDVAATLSITSATNNNLWFLSDTAVQQALVYTNASDDSFRFRLYDSVNTGSTETELRLYQLNEIEASGYMRAVVGYRTKAGSAGSYDASRNVFNIKWSSPSARLWIDTSDLGAISVASDPRFKKDVADTTTDVGALIDAIRVVDYRWDEAVCDDCDDHAHIGVLSTELQQVFPEAVNGESDSTFEDGKPSPQTVNTAPLVFAMVKELQMLRKRVSDLEPA